MNKVTTSTFLDAYEAPEDLSELDVDTQARQLLADMMAEAQPEIEQVLKRLLREADSGPVRTSAVILMGRAAVPEGVADEGSAAYRYYEADLAVARRVRELFYLALRERLRPAYDLRHIPEHGETLFRIFTITRQRPNFIHRLLSRLG